ncbi:hypothetical protein APB26_33005 [Pseudomonas aeruginosa]|nr:hypothetical protein APB26_33005 [Pseudomonas aeruginosa]RPV61475.1 hypothetical protein IPC838_19350 [Pseudomonas aeruginosa]
MASGKKSTLTSASGITAELVLELGKFSTAQDMRCLQTGLTSAARELRALTQGVSLRGRLGSQLSLEQRELLGNAAALLDSIKYNVEHAKERKARGEKDKEKWRLERERQAEQLVAQHFNFATDTMTEQMELLDLYLLAEAILGQRIYLKGHANLRQMMQEQPPQWFNSTMSQWYQYQARSLVVDLRSAFKELLCWDDKKTPAEKLVEAQTHLSERREEVLARPDSIQTRRVWSDALKSAAFITSAMTAGGSRN